MRLLNASGCLDAPTAPEVVRSFDAFVTKTVTPLPREGNDPIRIAEVEGGMLNAIGLANPGIERFCKETLPGLAGLEVAPRAAATVSPTFSGTSSTFGQERFSSMAATSSSSRRAQSSA